MTTSINETRSPEAAPFDGREPFVDMGTVAEFLSVSERTVQRWMSDSQCFPLYRLGRLVRFRLSEVERWVRTNRD